MIQSFYIVYDYEENHYERGYPPSFWLFQDKNRAIRFAEQRILTMYTKNPVDSIEEKESFNYEFDANIIKFYRYSDNKNCFVLIQELPLLDSGIIVRERTLSNGNWINE